MPDAATIAVPVDFLRLLVLGPEKKPVTDPKLDEDGWPKRWSDPTYLGDGPYGP